MMRRRVKLSFCALAGILAADQILNYTALADDVFLGRIIAPFEPPVFTPVQRRGLETLRREVAGDLALAGASHFDAELGWCPRPDSSWLGASFDALGARTGASPHAAQPAAGARRAIALGCSMTIGMEVGDADPWPARVEAGAPELEVVNLGVAGYGIDQAVLRYRRDGRGLGAMEVWVGVMPEAAMRVVTQYAPLSMRWAATCAFKPRFALDADGANGLRLVPNPAGDTADTLRLVTDQRAFVAALGETDFWVRRTPAAFAPHGTSPLHWFAMTRLALTAYELRDRSPEVWLRDPASEVYRVLLGILLALQEDAAADGARLRVVLLPSRPDLEGEAYWLELLRDLRANGIDCLDAAPALRAAGGADEPALWMRQGHYTPRANAVVADVVLAAWR